MAAASRPDRLLIEDLVAAKLEVCDPEHDLDSKDFHDVLVGVADRVFDCMDRESRSEMDDEDRKFIERRVRIMVRKCKDEYLSRIRFRRFHRVLCKIGGDRQWASGTVQAVNESDPQDPRRKLPYVVKIDPPNGRLVTVPNDISNLVRAEVCFGSRADALFFTLFSLPMAASKKPRRFAVGERVACAVEDDSDEYSMWAAGTVTEVDVSVESDAVEVLPQREWKGENAVVPYRVQLDNGMVVLVHRECAHSIVHTGA